MSGQFANSEADDLDESTEIIDLGALSAQTFALDARHVLVRMDGSDVGKVVTLKPNKALRVGRKGDSDLVLKYEGVSRVHAQIENQDGAYFVEDLNSSNGTTVRGKRIRRQRLLDGDIIRFGPKVRVRYSVTDANEESMLRRLYEASVRDSLTGAYNREYLAERLRSETESARSHGTKSSLIMFDLDHFKKVNDTYGHQAGDVVLLSVVSRVSSILRTEDVLARYGGEEFAISARGLDTSALNLLGERIRSANDTVLSVGVHRIKISISVGCASVSECDDLAPETLIELADKRLYEAKTGGRNRVVCGE